MKVFISHDRDDTKACAPLLRALDAWGVTYYFDFAEDVFGQQLSDRAQAELAESQVLLRVCTGATSRSYWMSIESGAFMGLLADDHRLGRGDRRIISLILDPAYAREPFDVTTTVIDATDTAHPQWVNAFRAALGLPPLHDLAEVARAIYSPPPAPRISRRAAIGLGAAGVVALAAAGTGGLVLFERGKGSLTTIGNSTPTPPTSDPAIKWATFPGDPKNLTSAAITATPVLDNGILYFGTHQGKFFAMRAEDHQVLWEYPHSSLPLAEITRSAAVTNGVAYFCSFNTGLFAVSALNGTKLWEQDNSFVFASSEPVLANGQIYVNSIGTIGVAFVGVGDLKGNQVAALSPSNGNAVGTSAPLVVGDRVYVGGNDGYLYALDATKTGPEIWRADTGATKAQQLKKSDTYYVSATPTIASSVIYVGSQDNFVYALDAGTGARLWSFPTNGPITYSSPVIANGVLYVGSNDNNLYALNARSGRLVWQYATGGQINGTPTLASGVVYAGSYDQYVHAVDATSGKLIRKYNAGGQVFAQPVVAEGVLYVVTGNGWVLAFHL
ncbi:MAG TPA: PQQ-binding-like beta-propeller repeat protein [Ktedonobacterales bacterium]